MKIFAARVTPMCGPPLDAFIEAENEVDAINQVTGLLIECNIQSAQVAKIDLYDAAVAGAVPENFTATQN